MGSSTSKGLYMPDEVGEVVDIAKINDNFERLNLYGMGSFVCTSTTRPGGADRWTGQVIYETDTKATGIYDGTNWIMYDSVWQPWTNQAFANFVKGTSTVAGQYFRTGKKVDAWCDVVLASGFSFNASLVECSLPVTGDPPAGSVLPIGQDTILDNGTGYYNSWVRFAGANTIVLHEVYAGKLGWANGDRFGFVISYRAA